MGLKRKTRHGINAWPKDDRPREKLLRNGEHTLSDAELLAILLRTGTKGQNAVGLGREIMVQFDSFRDMARLDLEHWRGVKGIGDAKIAQIKAAIEIGRRFSEQAAKRIKKRVESSKDVADIFMARMRDFKREVFKVVFLDAKNCIIAELEIAEGTVDYVSPIIREILQKALQYFAVSLICVHNHPSGDPTASREDCDFTRSLDKGAQLLKINVLDHIIIGDNRYYSFADNGKI